MPKSMHIHSKQIVLPYSIPLSVREKGRRGGGYKVLATAKADENVAATANAAGDIIKVAVAAAITDDA